MDFGGFDASITRLDRAAIAIVPVPYDATCTWLKGTEYGPEAILRASPYVEYYDIETDSEVFREGIHTDAPVLGHASPDAVVEAVEARVDGHLAAGRYTVTLGGEHSISVGAVRAHARRFPGVTVVQFDAHSDLRAEFKGSVYNHGCAAARMREVAGLVQVGIRSMGAEEKPFLVKENVFFAHDIVRDRAAWMDQALSRMGPDVYVTLDVDVFDPSIMPSTGTPEPGGLDWYDVTGLLDRIVAGRRLVGFDVVELLPRPCDPAPDFLVAKLVYRTLSRVFHRRRCDARGAAGRGGAR